MTKMKNQKRICFITVCLILALCLQLLAIVTTAHPGRTDANGGHYNHSTGGYHYHHGYSAHQHYDMNGDGIKDCPFEFKDQTNHSNSSNNNYTSDDYKNNDYKTNDNLESLEKLTFGDVLLIILKIIGKTLLILLMGMVGWFWIYSVLLYFLTWAEEKFFNKSIKFSANIISIIVIVVVVIIISSIIVLHSEGLL